MYGASCCGKTTLVNRMFTNIFEAEIDPTIYDDMEVELELLGKKFSIKLVDMSGQYSYVTLKQY